MGLNDFIDDEDVTDDNDEDEQSGENAYEAYANLDEELNPEVAAIVDEVIEQWNNDRMVDAYIDEDYVRVRRGELVYGIVNIAKRTQKFFDEQE